MLPGHDARQSGAGPALGVRVRPGDRAPRPAPSSGLPSYVLLHLLSRVIFWLAISILAVCFCPCISGGALTNAVSASQVYVALSRCRSLQHIRVLGFDPAKVKAHPAALRFVQGLANSAPRGAEPVAG